MINEGKILTSGQCLGICEGQFEEKENGKNEKNDASKLGFSEEIRCRLCPGNFFLDIDSQILSSYLPTVHEAIRR